MNKKIIAIFGALLVAVAIVVIGSVIFTVSSVEVRFRSENLVQAAADCEEEILSVCKGKSIIVFDEEELKQKAEKMLSYIEVVSVERVFPSKLIVYARERYEAYVIAYGNEYLFLDSTAKVLRISNSKTSSYTAGGEECVEVKVDYDDIVSCTVGEYISFKHDAQSEALKILASSATWAEGDYEQSMNAFKLRQYLSQVDLTNYPQAVVKMAAGAEFTLLSYYHDVEKFLRYMNAFYAQQFTAQDRINAKATVMFDEEAQKFVVTY